MRDAKHESTPHLGAICARGKEARHGRIAASCR
jgi:hypothetical protein